VLLSKQPVQIKDYFLLTTPPPEKNFYAPTNLLIISQYILATIKKEIYMCVCVCVCVCVCDLRPARTHTRMRTSANRIRNFSGDNTQISQIFVCSSTKRKPPDEAPLPLRICPPPPAPRPRPSAKWDPRARSERASRRNIAREMEKVSSGLLSAAVGAASGRTAALIIAARPGPVAVSFN